MLQNFGLADTLAGAIDMTIANKIKAFQPPTFKPTEHCGPKRQARYALLTSRHSELPLSIQIFMRRVLLEDHKPNQLPYRQLITISHGSATNEREISSFTYDQEGHR
jgi:hypothetical protein